MIRKATINDINGINKLLNEVLLIHHEIRPDLFKKEGKKYTDEELIKIINNELTPIFVYVDESNQILGHAFTQIRVHEEKENTYPYTTLFIDDLCVEENARGMQIGTKLYSYCKDFALKNHYHSVTLDVWQGNDKAMEFYNKIGLVPQQIVMEEIIDKENK